MIKLNLDNTKKIKKVESRLCHKQWETNKVIWANKYCEYFPFNLFI